MSAQDSAGDLGASYIKRIDDCNRVVRNVEETERLDKPSEGSKFVSQTTLRKYLALDANGQYQALGYITDAGHDFIQNADPDIGLDEMLDSDGLLAWKEKTHPKFHLWNDVWPPRNKENREAPQESENPESRLPLLKIAGAWPYVRILGGHSDSRIGKHVSYLLGTVRHEIHITVWTTSSEL